MIFSPLFKIAIKEASQVMVAQKITQIAILFQMGYYLRTRKIASNSSPKFSLNIAMGQDTKALDLTL